MNDNPFAAPHCNECGHQMIRDVRSKVNIRTPIWYCPTPEKHEEGENND